MSKEQRERVVDGANQALAFARIMSSLGTPTERILAVGHSTIVETDEKVGRKSLESIGFAMGLEGVARLLEGGRELPDKLVLGEEGER
jgi:hypothetical protein